MFYGSGAGKLPTASAVVADMVGLARHMDCNIPVEWKPEKISLLEFGKIKNAFFVRTSSGREEIKGVFGTVDFVDAGVDGECGFVTPIMAEAEFKAKAAALDVRSVIRMGNQ